MAAFDDRQKAFEQKFVHDQEIQFKVQARRNRLLGEWAGEMMHYEESQKRRYALEIVKEDIKEPGDDDVIDKIVGDVQEQGIELSRQQVREEMERLEVIAKIQICEEQEDFSSTA